MTDHTNKPTELSDELREFKVEVPIKHLMDLPLNVSYAVEAYWILRMRKLWKGLEVEVYRDEVSANDTIKYSGKAPPDIITILTTIAMGHDVAPVIRRFADIQLDRIIKEGGSLYVFHGDTGPR